MDPDRTYQEVSFKAELTKTDTTRRGQVADNVKDHIGASARAGFDGRGPPEFGRDLRGEIETQADTVTCHPVTDGLIFTR